MEKLIAGCNITKSFITGGRKQEVLKSIDLSVDKGEFVSIMGASGSGKSTLLYALSGMDRMDDGVIIFGQENMTALSDNALSDLRRKYMGFVFQQPTFLKNLNLLDNIVLPMMRDHRKHRKLLIQRAIDLMKQTGIDSLKSRDITQVSGGQLQRAGICRAIMNKPSIIFGDEPTGALNTKTAKEIMDLLSDINKQGTALLLVTHDAQVAARSQRVLFIHDGKILQELKLPVYRETEQIQRAASITAVMQTLGI